MRAATRYFGQLVALLVLLVVACPAAKAVDWDCYAPKPGHPTQDEKKEFLVLSSKLAREAEQKFGVPAAALTSMSILESGFGYTRIALEANNLFGYKYYGINPADGRQSWQLECQPASDPNNLYIKFKDPQDAFLFVARKLAVLPRYAEATSNYAKAVATGGPVDKAVDAWVRAVAAAGYNPDPSYPGRLIAIMSNPLDPSGQFSSADNLYRLSEPAKPELAASKTSIMSGVTNDQFARVLQYVAKGTPYYMKQICSGTSYPGWENVDILQCQYTVGRTEPVPQTGFVVLYVPSDEQLTRWYLSACKQVAPTALEACAKSISEWVDGQSGRQFPISGIVLENISKKDQPAYRHELYLFRDGVSVTVKGFPNSDTTIMNLNAAQTDVALNGEIEKRFDKARIQSTTVNQYLAYMKRLGQQADNPNGMGWLAISRKSFQQALGSDDNLLLNAWATDPKVAPCLLAPQKAVSCLLQ